MLLDEQQNALGVLLREPQARQQRGRKRTALLRMAAEVTDPLLVYGLAGRFSAVVQQHRPPQTGIRRNLPDRANGMPPDVVTVMRIILCAAEHRHELRQRRADDVVVFQQRALRPTAAQQPRQLLAHALCCNAGKADELPPHRRSGVLLDRKAQLGRKAHAAQNAQRILSKARIRIADRTQNAVFQVVLTAERVKNPAFRMPRHRADREIAPREVLTDAAHKAHAVRVTAVRIAAVRAVGRDFERTAVQHHGQCAVFETGLNDLFALENAQHLLRRCRRTQVPVVRPDAAQAVAHTAADRPGLKPGLFQTLDRARRILRQVHHLSPLS